MTFVVMNPITGHFNSRSDSFGPDGTSVPFPIVKWQQCGLAPRCCCR